MQVHEGMRSSIGCDRHTQVLRVAEGARGVVRLQASAAGTHQSISEGFPARAGALAAGTAMRVFAERGPFTRISRAEVVALLRQHLRHSLLRIGGRWHVQSRGISQARNSWNHPTLCTLDGWHACKAT